MSVKGVTKQKNGTDNIPDVYLVEMFILGVLNFHLFILLNAIEP